MKVRAPFVIEKTYKGKVELFSWRMMQTWFDEFEWNYWFCQRLWRKRKCPQPTSHRKGRPKSARVNVCAVLFASELTSI